MSIKYLPVHWLSKDARRKIIQFMLTTRSIKQLARELGVSTTAVRKYINGETHPSDETMIRVFEILAPYEENRIYKIMIDDLIDALNKLIDNINDDPLREYIYSRLRRVMRNIEER